MKFIQRRIRKSDRATTDSRNLQEQRDVGTALKAGNIERASTAQASGVLRQMAFTFIFTKIWSFQIGSPRHQAPLSNHGTGKRLPLLCLC